LIRSRPNFYSETKKLAGASLPPTFSAGETKKTREEKLYCEVNLKDSVVNNIDLKEEMSFLYNKYTNNNNNCFVFSSRTPKTNLVAWARPRVANIKRHFPTSFFSTLSSINRTLRIFRAIAQFSTTRILFTNAPAALYTDVIGQKETILNENKGKSGVYCWTNLIIGKQYIGSSVRLKSRFNHYFNEKFLTRNANQSIIYRALLKTHGYSNFSLTNLEYPSGPSRDLSESPAVKARGDCDKDAVTSREQYYMDKLKPAYNIALIAGSRLGLNQSPEAKKLISVALTGRVLSEETKAKIVNTWSSLELSEAHKAHLIELQKTSQSPERIAQAIKNLAEYHAEHSKVVKATTIETGHSVTYPSIRQTARAFNTTCTTIGKYINKQQIYLGKYNLTKITTTRSMSTMTKTDNVPMLYSQKLSNVSVKNLNSSNNTRVPIKKHYPAAPQEWNNSVYAYNSKRTILLSAIDKIVIKLIKSYFNAYFLSSSGFPTKIRKLSADRQIYISKLEVKHTNSKVIITVFVYCAAFKKFKFLYENLSPCGGAQGRRPDGKNFSFADLIAKCYNKKVELRVIRLRDMQLDAKILAERLANQIAQRTISPLRTLRGALRTVRIPKVNLKLYYLRKSSLNNSALYDSISTLNVGGLKKINKTSVRNEILACTKYKSTMGVKIQIAGRLTRRATAAKAIFKGGQVGGLKNIDSSVLGFSVGLLRGHHKPNIQKAFHNSITKNGSFNVRVWTSSFYSTLATANKTNLNTLATSNKTNLNPSYITGFTDGDGCF
jgi:group I intron endonuclease